MEMRSNQIMKVQLEIEYESPIEIWKEKSIKSNEN